MFRNECVHLDSFQNTNIKITCRVDEWTRNWKNDELSDMLYNYVFYKQLLNMFHVLASTEYLFVPGGNSITFRKSSDSVGQFGP